MAPGSWGGEYGRYYATVNILSGPKAGGRYYYWVEGPKAGQGVYNETKDIVGNIIIPGTVQYKQTQLRLF